MIAVIDYGAGNLTSVKRALDYIGAPCVVTDDVSIIMNSEKAVFPGVGHARDSMRILKQKSLDSAVKNFVSSGRPFLGICLGTQIILECSEEGDTPCLGLMPGKTVHFPEDLKNKGLKIPHMGWNRIRKTKDHPLLKGVEDGSFMYFVHSYYPAPDDKSAAVADTEYGIDFVSGMASRNIAAFQFHPEKSGEAGLSILRNFCGWGGTDAE
ncbi:MAG: imidazole glycerol phosphate synthase subunit HisH [Fibrobacterota bacterium]